MLRLIFYQFYQRKTVNKYSNLEEKQRLGLASVYICFALSHWCSPQPQPVDVIFLVGEVAKLLDLVLFCASGRQFLPGHPCLWGAAPGTGAREKELFLQAPGAPVGDGVRGRG